MTSEEPMLTAVIVVLALWGAFVFALDPDRIYRKNFAGARRRNRAKEQ
jgi:hypothetical protein